MNAQQYIAEMQTLLAAVDAAAIDRLADILVEAWRRDRTIMLFGNGGSAYTSSHFVTDLVKTAQADGQRPLRAMSLVDNYGLSTALANDVGYGRTFVYPLQAYARPGDVAVAISASGSSPNVVEACRHANEQGLTLVCLTGFEGGAIGPLADLHVNIPSGNYGLIEDLHLSVGHMVSQSLKSRISAETSRP